MSCGFFDRVSATRSRPLPPEMTPGPIIAGTFYRVTQVAAGLPGRRRIAIADPSRIMIGFVPLHNDAATAYVQPGQLTGSPGWSLVEQTPVQWFKLQDYGPLVQDEWYATFLDTTGIAVVEVLKIR